MIDKQVVEDIVLQVLKKQGLTRHDIKPKLLVISRNNIDEQVMKTIENRWSPVSLKPGMDEVPSGTEHAVFLDVDQDLLVKSSLGMADTDESRVFSELMLQGTKIHFVLEDKWKWLTNDSKPIINRRYEEMLSGYCKKLEDYGVTFTNIEKLTPADNEQQDSHMFKEKLLTQKVIEEWRENEIRISQGTIVTPLAKDAARERDIRIIDHKEREGGK